MKYRYYKIDTRLLLIMSIYLNKMIEIGELVSDNNILKIVKKYLSNSRCVFIKNNTIRYFAKADEINEFMNIFFKNYNNSIYFKNNDNLIKEIKLNIPVEKQYQVEYLYNNNNLQRMLDKEKTNILWFSKQSSFIKS